MFKFFKRSAIPAHEARRSRRSPEKGRPSRALPLEAESLLMIEVIEGNDDKDWDLWQDSVSLMDSQMQSLMPSTAGSERWHLARKDADPYASVRKRDM